MGKTSTKWLQREWTNLLQCHLVRTSTLTHVHIDLPLPPFSTGGAVAMSGSAPAAGDAPAEEKKEEKKEESEDESDDDMGFGLFD